MIHFCTYFDANYLTRAIALYRSLERYAPAFTLWALCMDDEAYETVDGLALPGLRPIRLADLEAADPELLAAKDTRTRIEYYFTCSPAYPRFLMRSHPEIDLITYLDADLLFFSSPEPIFTELGEGSVLIVPHRYAVESAELEIYGRFNVGLVGFRNDERGHAILERWRAQCIEWCYDRAEGERYADQRYLDEWPGQPGVVVLENPGAGLAPWNAMTHAVDIATDPPTVDGHALVFYHFAGVRQVGRGLWDTRSDQYGVIGRRVRFRLYGRYIAELEQAAALVRGWANRRGGHGASLRTPRTSTRRLFGRIRHGQVIVSNMTGLLRRL